MSTNNELENKTYSNTEKPIVQENINGNITNSHVTRIKIKYGNKSLEKEKEENIAVKYNECYQINGKSINCIPTVLFNPNDTSAPSDLQQSPSATPIHSGLVIDPDQTIQSDHNHPTNLGLITTDHVTEEHFVSEEMPKQNESLSNPSDKSLLFELLEVSESSSPDIETAVKKSDDQLKQDPNDELILLDQCGKNSTGLAIDELSNYIENKTKTDNSELSDTKQDDNQDNELDKVTKFNTSQYDGEFSPTNYDYLTMINQEVCGLVNAIPEDNSRTSEDEVIDDINSESSTVDNVDNKPIILEESDAQCIFGWTLLSPGLMEIKINPDSDDSNDVIRIRRTASLQCRIESGDINKLNAFRENNDKVENINDFGEMEYVDFLEYLSQVTNRSANETQESDGQTTITLQTEGDDNKQMDAHMNSKRKIIENLSQMDPEHSDDQNHISITLPNDKKGECGVDVIEGPQEMSFPTEEDNIMSIKFIMPSNSAELQPRTREDGEAASISKSPDLTELEEANKNLAKEKSLISIRHQQSLEQQQGPVGNSRSENNEKKRKNALYRWLKSKKHIPSTVSNPSNTPNKVAKKKKSWFRFWF